MNLVLVIKLALNNIVNSKLRSSLTMLGLVIGVSSVIILVGIGQGAVSSVNNQVASMGADVITINIEDTDYAISYEDVSAISGLNNIDNVSPYQILSSTLSNGSETATRANVVGTGDAYIGVMGYSIESGRNLSRVDTENCTKVTVIGSGVVEELWGNADPVGDTLKIEGDNYTVVGILESVGSSMGNNIDESVIIPITTAKYLGTDTGITNLYVSASDEKTADLTVVELENYFARELGIGTDDVTISTQEMMIDAMDDINNTLSLLLGGIAGISLLVGGIGVMNIMLVSVAERTREIGIRKSLGAKKKDIMKQFLMESMVLSFLGGMIGILTGFAGGAVAKILGVSFAPSLGIVLLAVGVSIAVGVLFGLFPSYRAASLKPVEALRYE